MNMLSTEVDIIEKHNFVCPEQPALAVSGGGGSAAAAAMSAAAMSAADSAVRCVVRKAAVNGLTVCRLHDIMPADVLLPPKGLQGLVSHPSKKLYTILSLMVSASTCHNFTFYSPSSLHHVMCCKALVHIFV